MPATAPRRHSAVLLILLAAALLTACGSAPTRKGGGKGGGYYLDDGPADHIPVDLDKIPDATPRIEPLHQPSLRPYTVMGKRYTPFTTFTPYRERGTASWYGKKFHGQNTSTGEPYDMFAMTAAHTTLPLPSYARVTNLNNGRSVIVRVNDRGPFLHERIMDLSYAAAYRLGYVNSGSAPVEVEAILPEEIRLAQNAPRPGGATSQPVAPPPDADYATLPPVPQREPAAIELEPLAPIAPAVPATADAAPSIPFAPVAATTVSTPAALAQGTYIQLGAFASPATAQSLAARARVALGDLAHLIRTETGGQHTRVQIGPFPSEADARAHLPSIGQALGLKPFVVK